jgi:hypothetical protein
MTNPEMSIFDSVTSKTSGTQSFSQIIDSIRETDYCLTIEDIRDQNAQGNKSAADLKKKTLPAFTPSGIFELGHTSQDLVEYSGILHLDIDKLEDYELIQLEHKLRESKDTLAFFRSPSGNGLKVFFLCNDIRENHQGNMLKLFTVFENRYNFRPDPACKDISRLCFFSHDPNAYYNPQADRIQLKADFSKFERIALRLEKERNIQFKEGSRNEFVFQFALYCKNENLSSIDVLKYASETYIEPNFPLSEIKNIINSAYKKDYSVGLKSRLNLSKFDQIAQAFSVMGYQFKRNIVKNSIDCCLENNRWVDLTETIINDLIREAHNMGIKAKDSDIRTVLYSSLYESYDPFMNYLDNLEPWDGYDYIGDLCASLNVDKTYQPYIRKWLILLVAGIIDESITNPYVLTLIGPQGVGKTRWLIKLIPPPLRQYMYQGIPDLKDKDTKIALAENLIFNIDELDALNRGETARLKEFITSPGYKIRAPYGKIQEFRRRRASFCASVNNPNFLMDKTGSRRYLCIEIPSKIDHMHNINADKLYAQALFEAQKKDALFFTDLETEAIQEKNESFKSYSMEEELLNEYVRKPLEGESYKCMAATEIARHIANADETFKPNSRTNSEIGTILTNKGYNRIKSGGSNKYKVVLINPSQDNNYGLTNSRGWGG